MSLKNLVEEASQLHDNIENIDKLKDKRAKVEKELYDKLWLKGERLEDPVLDYCFSLPFLRNLNVNGQEVYKSAFEILPQIELFFQMVKDRKDSAIAVFYGDIPTETGKMSGECLVKINQMGEYHHRELFVPVKKLLKYNLEKNEWWIEDKNKDINITQNIFLCPDKNNFNPLLSSCFKTDHSKEIYVGGPTPEETTVYIGTTPFSKSRPDLSIKVTKETIIPKPNF